MDLACVQDSRSVVKSMSPFILKLAALWLFQEDLFDSLTKMGGTYDSKPNGLGELVLLLDAAEQMKAAYVCAGVVSGPVCTSCSCVLLVAKNRN